MIHYRTRSVSDNVHRELWEQTTHQQWSRETTVLQPHRVRVPGPHGGSDATGRPRDRHEASACFRARVNTSKE